mgnify:CR=1 FL=1
MASVPVIGAALGAASAGLAFGLAQTDLPAVTAGVLIVVLLGVGPDGHVASLFPGHPAQLLDDALAVAVHDSPKPPPRRITLTLLVGDVLERLPELDARCDAWFLDGFSPALNPGMWSPGCCASCGGGPPPARAWPPSPSLPQKCCPSGC